MFTGIIETVGEVAEIKKSNAVWQFKIKASKDFVDLPIGASVACSGACLTVIEKNDDSFTVDATSETLDCTGLGNWHVGSAVNLERGMQAQSRFDGHIVSGHVDGMAELIEIKKVGEACACTFRAPSDLSALIASKGSVALDGVSLTVNAVRGDLFDIMLIPHTLEMLGWDQLQIGTGFNLEIDLIARYIARLIERRRA